MIFELIKILLISLFGVDNAPKNDLRRKKKVSFSESLGDWALSNAHILLPLAIIVLLLLIGAVIGVMLSGGNMTMTESNNYYYHLKDVI